MTLLLFRLLLQRIVVRVVLPKFHTLCTIVLILLAVSVVVVELVFPIPFHRALQATLL